MESALKQLVGLLRSFGVPKRVTYLLVAPICVLGLLAGAYKALTELGVAAPWSAVIAAGLVICGGWLTLGWRICQDEDIASLVLVLILIPVIVVLCVIWHFAGWVSLRIPFLAGSAIGLGTWLLMQYKRDALPFAARLSGTLFLSLVVFSVGQYATHRSPTPPRRVGVWVAQYELDSDGKAQAGVIAQLGDVIRRDPELASVVEVRDLRRVISGETDTQRFAEAQKIGTQVGAGLVVFGTVTGRGVATKIAVVAKPTSFKGSELHTLVTDFTLPMDVQLTYLLAKTITGVLDLILGQCGPAERKFRDIEPEFHKVQSVVARETLRHYMAVSIACEAQFVAAGGAERLREAGVIYQDLTRSADERMSAQGFAGAGFVYRRLADYDQPIENLNRAIAAYTKGMQLSSSPNPDLASVISTNLGVAHEKLAQYERPEEHLKKAIAAHRAALKTGDRARNSPTWATTQSNLGVAYKRLAEHRDTIENLKLAIAAYHDGLAALELDRAFSKTDRQRRAQARLDSNLGDAYSELSLHEDKSKNLDRAMTALNDALTLAPRATDPDVFAETHFHLGTVYMMRSRGGKPPDVPRGLGSLACSLVVLDQLGLNRAATAANFLRNLEQTAERDDRGSFGKLLASAPPPESCMFRSSEVLALIDKWAPK